MPRYALTLEYDGTAFSGTQTQLDLRTLKGVLEAALSGLDGQPVIVRLASRLDQGVSAEALVGDCLLSRDWKPATLVLALVSRLPGDVVVRAAARVDDRWCAQYACQAKTYEYRVLIRGVRPVLDRRCWWVRQIDHPELLDVCAAALVGHRNLAGFASRRGDDSDDQDPVRFYRAAAWTHRADAAGDHWIFRITGEGFLYKQVRALVGAMVYVAQGRTTVDRFLANVAHGWGAPRLGNLAPGHGLVLIRAEFEPEPAWESP